MQVSIWEQDTFLSHKDVIIIGSGFAGLWTALELKKQKPSLSICVVDRGIIPTGASTRNAGFSCFGSLTELVADAATLGEEKMLELVMIRHNGLKKIRRTFGPSKIGYENRGGYELFSDKPSAETFHLEKQIKKINKLLKPLLKEEKVFRLADKKIKNFGFAGVEHLVENRMEGQLHPGKLTTNLLKKANQEGIDTLFGIEVTGFHSSDQKVELATNHHFSLTASQVIICTNAFTDTLLPGIDVKPARGQVFVTSEIPDLPFKGTFHYDVGFYYFRNLGNRILLGGARNKFFEEEETPSFDTSENIQKELERFLKEVILPGETKFSIDYRWSGIMGMGKEKLPIIQEVKPGVFCALAMGGIGVATAPIVAEKVAKMVLRG